MPNVKLQLASKGNYVFYTGASGSFGIPVSKQTDSILLTLDGYQELAMSIETSKYQYFILKPLNAAANTSNGLMSFTKNLFRSDAAKTVTNGAETYNSLVENDFINTKIAAETGLSLNINCASYSNIRRFLNMESLVPPDGVRIEEMLNYFNLNTAKQKAVELNASFVCTTQVTSCPWNKNNQLLFIELLAPKLNLSSVPPAHLTFLIDVSGSMDRDNRLPLVQKAFKMLVQNLRAQDTVAIVTYGGYVGIALRPTGGDEKNKICNVIDSLAANGDTPGSAAIQTAYRIAESIYSAQGNNRVILATDGDFNVGQTSEKELQNMIAKHKQSGIYLTCLGIGMGNYKNSKLEALATNGNGNFAYIDNLREAQKTLMTEFTKNMYTVANDAHLTVQFNKEMINAYRLIGFDNKKDDIAASNAAIEGGEIGSGHAVMAIFELVPTLSTTDKTATIATLHLQYKEVRTSLNKQQNFDVPQNFTPLNDADSCLRLATSIVMFGSLLKQSKYAANYNWDEVRNIAVTAVAPDNILEEEFLTLVSKAKKIYAGVNDKRKKK